MYKQIVARHNEAIFNSYLKPSIESFGLMSCDVHDGSSGESLCKKYNAGINAFREKKEVGIKDEDIIGFIHEDVRILDGDFLKKLSYVFQSKPDVGMVGLCGTSLLDHSCMWWNSKDHLRGHLIQEDQSGNAFHHSFGNIGYYDDLVVVDGFFFAIRGELFNKGLKFDETYPNFDFYDLDICFSVLEMGYKISVIDLLLQHKSVGGGVKDQRWSDNRKRFLDKYIGVGKKDFPITRDSFVFSIVMENEDIELFEV
jgi:hypothetical protein